MTDPQKKSDPQAKDEPLANVPTSMGAVCSPEEVHNLQAEIERLTNSLARSQADLDNFRKRQVQEQENFLKFANSQLILELLPVIDNFNRAFQHTPDNLKNDQWFIGVLAIEKQFLLVLEKLGVKKIETIGKKADPHLHEIIGVSEKEKTEKDTVIEEVEAGYLLNGKVIRPAKVMVQK